MYSTIDSVKNKINWVILLQLINDEGRPEVEIALNDPNDPAVKRFNKAAEDAQIEIDPYLQGRYTLPFVTVPGIIANISDEITIYNIYKNRNRDNIPKSTSDIKENMDKLLEKISLGKVDLGIKEEKQTISNEIKTNKTAADRIFNTDMWSKY